MIRRDSIAPNGVSSWVLIPQIEHATLAGDLAEDWGAMPLASLGPGREVRAAIAHHDDGWAAWDSLPDVDSQTGVPLAFNEMPLPESLAIWDRSIELAKKWSELASHAVAGHFCALLRRFDSWKKDAEKRALAIEFLARHEYHMAAQLARWKAGDHPEWTVEIAAKAVAYVQFFDAVSLWLCCAERTAPERFQPPDGPAVDFTPRASNLVQVSPWPWTDCRRELAVTGHRIVATRYADRTALARAPSDEVQRTWHFEP